MPISQAAFEDMAKRYAEAWSSGDPEAVASFYEENGRLVINDGEPTVGRVALAEVAQAFYDDFPGLLLHCDLARVAGNNGVFLWTLEGTHSGTGNQVKVGGWEAWRLSDDIRVIESDGRFDAIEYERQIQEGV